ncbi:heparinase II/III family protein, partial [Vibrio splendidus]
CWYDMADSFRLMLIIDILSNKDYLEYISVHKRKILDFSARIHHQVLMKNGYASKGNHRIFQLLSLLRYSKFIENKEDESKFKNEILKFYHLQFDKDGVHLEHSPEYHVWATLLFKEIFSNFDDLNNNSDLISKAMDFSKYLFCSNYKLALIGDSGLDNNTEYCNLIQPMFREKGSFSLENTHYIINGNDCLGQYFICILSANSRVHKHSDSGSFEFTTNKKKVITDSGKYSYTKSSKSKEIRSIKSHNVAYKVGYEVTNDLTYSIFEKTIQNEAVLYCIKGSGDYSDHTRFFIILEQSSLVVIDIFDKGDNYRSIVNFDPGLDWKKYYQPLLGIKSWEEEVGIHSQYYGEANENNRIVQTISNISCYAISSIPIERFSYTNNEIFIYYRKNEYTFKLKR